MRRPIRESNWRSCCDNSGRWTRSTRGQQRPGTSCTQSGTSLQVLLPKVRLGALTPSPHKIIIQPSADGRTCDWTPSPRPLLNCFLAGLSCDPLDHLWHKAIDHFLFQYLATDVHTSGAGRGDPELRGLLIGLVFEAVDQT